MVRSGRLSHIIELHRTVANRRTPVQIGDRLKGDVFNEYGVPQIKASPASARIRAEVIEPRKEFDQLDSGIKAERHVTFKIRYLQGLLADDIIVFEGREFRIVQVLEIGRRRALELLTIGGKLARPKTDFTRNLNVTD